MTIGERRTSMFPLLDTNLCFWQRYNYLVNHSDLFLEIQDQQSNLQLLDDKAERFSIHSGVFDIRLESKC